MPDREFSDSERDWLRVREHLGERRYELGVQAAREYPDAVKVTGTPLLTRPDWVLDNPIPLADIELVFEPDTLFVGVRGDDPAAAAVLPVRPDGSRYRTYSEAMAELAAPAVFQNRGTYRLLDANLTGERPRMVFGRGMYFDGIDVGESVAHEYAAHDLDGRPTGRWRAAVGHPSDPGGHPMNVAISTLTIRRDREGGGSTCLLHWRDPTKVGHAGGLYQVIPVGIFQASGNQSWNELNDFSLWRCIVREIAEELLGQSEDHGSDTAPIDYTGWPLARALQDALDVGRASAVCLGMGTDPLTLATDLLTAVIIDDEVFDTLFAELVSSNAEGHLSALAVPFDREAAERFGFSERMQAAGAAALLLGVERGTTLLHEPM